MNAESTRPGGPGAPVLGEKENFLGLGSEHSAYETSAFVVQQVPYEKTSSYLAGSANGPGAIVTASHYVEYYDEVLNRETCFENGICTLAPYDITETDEAAVNAIAIVTERLLADGKFVVSMGGEHTVTLGFVSAYVKRFPNLSVVQLDAHSDLRDAYMDNPYSHACVMARIRELGVNICQAGIRAQSREEAELIRSDPRIHAFYAHQLHSNPEWMNEAVSCLTDDVYVTIDADVFDPSVIPAVGTAEPGGLFWEETLEFLSKLAAAKRIVGFDVVEMAPRGEETRSAYTLAKLAYRLMGLAAGKL